MPPRNKWISLVDSLQRVWRRSHQMQALLIRRQKQPKQHRKHRTRALAQRDVFSCSQLKCWAGQSRITQTQKTRISKGKGEGISTMPVPLLLSCRALVSLDRLIWLDWRPSGLVNNRSTSTRSTRLWCLGGQKLVQHWRWHTTQPDVPNLEIPKHTFLWFCISASYVQYLMKWKVFPCAFGHKSHSSNLKNGHSKNVIVVFHLKMLIIALGIGFFLWSVLSFA